MCSFTMTKTSACASIVIELGNTILSDNELKEFEEILDHVSSLLLSTCPQRVFISYSLLLLSSLKV